MSPVEAWEAVKSGKKVERVDACGTVRALRWHNSLGVLAEYRDEWIPDGMPRMAIYREAWQCPSCQVTHAALAREARDHRAAVEAASAAAKKMCDYAERVKLLDGLLDEALDFLKGVPLTSSLAASIRERRDGK